MRPRPLLLVVLLVSLLVTPLAQGYPWPLKPFDRQHLVRANLGDPRTRFSNTLLTDGLRGPGLFQFHNGIDISAPEGTPVYPVVSGTASLIDDSAVSVRTKDNRTFQYFHIVPEIAVGQHVVARRTILGRVMHVYEHLHLTEIRGHRVWNPFAAGGIRPYSDRTVPEVSAVDFRTRGSLLPLDPARVCGTVSIVAAAFDPPPLPLPHQFVGYGVSPALVTWSLRRVGGRVLVQDVAAADFRTTLPRPRDFWAVYARGTFQNSPRFSNRQYFMPGRYYYKLAGAFDTREHGNGTYEVSVRAQDVAGNESELQQRFTILNRHGSPGGCGS